MHPESFWVILARLAYETLKELMANVFQQLVFEKSSKGGGACGVA